MIAMDYNEEVLSAAEEVEMQAALLCAHCSALQNWVPSGTPGTALNGHKHWRRAVLTPVP